MSRGLGLCSSKRLSVNSSNVPRQWVDVLCPQNKLDFALWLCNEALTIWIMVGALQVFSVLYLLCVSLVQVIYCIWNIWTIFITYRRSWLASTRSGLRGVFTSARCLVLHQKLSWTSVTFQLLISNICLPRPLFCPPLSYLAS